MSSVRSGRGNKGQPSNQMVPERPLSDAEIDADLAAMAEDAEYQAEARAVAAEFDQASWEAWQHAEQSEVREHGRGATTRP